VLPELFIAGYPPEDLVLKPAFQSACRAAIEELARDTADGCPAVLMRKSWSRTTSSIMPAPCWTDGRIAALRFKANLPNYGVFDEKRLFARGPAAGRGGRFAAFASACRFARTSGLEESEEYENVANAWRRPARKFWWCRTARPTRA